MKKLGPTIIEFLDHSNRIEREYSNTALVDAKKAWRYLENVKIITPNDMVEVQRLLLHRIAPTLVGLRTYPVRIGWQVKGFTSTQTFERQLSMICDEMNKPPAETEVENELRAKNCHITFEEVHPWGDGNGRSGRIFYNWHRLQLGLPIHVIHEGDEQYEYYTWFDIMKPV